MSVYEREFAERVLFGARLSDKLETPAAVWPDLAPGPPLGDVALPGRPSGLSFATGAAAPFPKPDALGDARARGQILHFFANHELLALELMALALLRFPAAPPAFRQGLVRTMQEEQAHMRLYLGRMAELGVAFGDLPVSAFFWRALSGMRSPLEYVAGMSLTLEQANLDFSLHYRDLFQAAGDVQTAEVLTQVYLEEIGHVRHGLVWFNRWRPPAADAWASYTASLRLPLSPARAKAEPFNRDGRRAAGLSAEFIRHLELFGGGKGRPPAVYWFNPDVEQEVGRVLTRDRPPAWGASCRSARQTALVTEAELALTFLARPGDVVICHREPSLAWQADWRALGVALPEFRAAAEPLAAVRALARGRALGELCPWGWGPRALQLAAGLGGTALAKDAERQRLRRFFSKAELPALRARVRAELPELGAALGPGLMDGRLVADEAELRALVRQAAAELGCAVLVKAPFSAAGAMRLRVDDAFALNAGQRAWLAKAWRQWGALLAEPCVAVVADGSCVGAVGERPRATLFLCDRRGQYRGHHLLRNAFGGAPEPVRQCLAARGSGGSTVGQGLVAAAEQAFSALAAWGYAGRAGVDFHVYRLPNGPAPGRLHIQAVGEINARTTMGHVAVALTKLLAPGTTGLWLTLRRRDLGVPAGVPLSGLADELRQAHPLQRDPLGRGRLRAGFLFVNDWTLAEHALSVAAVGERAIRHLRQISGLSSAELPPRP